MTDKPYEIVCDATEEQNWLSERTRGIGASEMSSVLGLNPWKSALQLYAEKIGAVEQADLSDNEPVQWGKRLEPLVIDAYADRSGRPVEIWQQLLRSKEHPWALATPDAHTGELHAPAIRWPLEVKTTSAFRADDWLDAPPEIYRIQVHAQMIVTGAQLATLAVLLGGQRLVWCDVPRDEVLIRRIIYAGEQFWRRVEARDPPPADGDTQTLRKIFPQDDGSTIELPAELLDVVDEIELLRSQDKGLEARRKKLEALLLQAMGPATTGVFASGPRVTWKAVHRAGYTVAANTQRILRIIQPKRLRSA